MMILLMPALLTSTALVLEAPTLVVAAVLIVSVCLALSRRQEYQPVQLDRRTLADIGIEPGSITWLR